MRHVPIWLLSLCLLFLLAAPAVAAPEGACYVGGAQRLARQAHRAHVRAAVRDREAAHVLAATRAYCGLYGSSVGRWTRLARRVGWGWGLLPNLMYIINRESRGDPTAVNASSGCTGLLQILPSNVDAPWRLDEADYNLKSGLKLYREAGWSPWSL